MSRRSVLSNAAAVATFIAAALWTMSGLAGRSAAAIPGTHLADNAAALWNVWWFTYAIEHGSAIYRTPMLFAPFGTQLSLHTHATTHSLLSWPWMGINGIVGSHNLGIACGLSLNGLVTFLLARAVFTHPRGPTTPADAPGVNAPPAWAAMAAGLMFAFSAFIQSRVLGHINLVHAWVLPLFAWSVLRLQRQPVISNAIWLGLAAALVIYTDYYYAVYAGIFLLIWIADRMLTVRVQRRAAAFPTSRRILLALMVVDLVIIAMIAFTDGAAVALGPFRVSMRGVRNPLTLFWLLLAAWAVCRFPFGLSVRRAARPAPGWLPLALAGLTVLILLCAPLWTALGGVIVAGDYTTQRILWRSSPAGVDPFTLVLGHPEHVITGAWTTSAYDALGIDAMEQSLWLGLVALTLIAATRRGWRNIPEARFWAVVGAVFLVLALGPFLRVGGVDTGLPLPQALLRYVPGFSNARIPGRAVVMVDLSVAMLAAFALRQLAGRARWLVVALLIVETLPAPAAVIAIPGQDQVDDLLRDSRIPGAVAELPVGLRDGFGESGQLDHRALIHQLWHQRPLVGGFVARLAAGVREQYLASPLLSNLLEISTPAKPEADLDESAARAAAELGIAFLVVNRDTFVDARLPRERLEHAGFTLVVTAGPRELYAARSLERRAQ